MSPYKTFKLQLEPLEGREMLDAGGILPPVLPATTITASVTAVTSSLSLSEKVLKWNQLALDAIKTTATSPPVASRGLAMLSLAEFEAVNGVTKQYASYYGLTAPKLTSADAAVAVASHMVLVKLFPTQKAIFDAELYSQLRTPMGGWSKALGMTYGGRIGLKILADRATDGSTTVVPYTSSGQVGFWEPTPPGFVASPLLPQWKNLRPFAMTSSGQYLVTPPPSLTSAEYTAALNEVKDLGSSTSAIRTADQTEIARFWAAGGGTVTPPGMWNEIAVAQIRANSLSATDAARVLAITNVALADAAIASWNAKYTYDFWRPVSAIRKADLDNNPDTTQDATWTSLIGTPPFSSYTSGHSTFSAAAAEVLSHFFGSNTGFSGTSQGTPGVTRSWTSFRAAAEEASLSRIYGGIHFRFDSEYGVVAGTSVGLKALQRFGVATMA